MNVILEAGLCKEWEGPQAMTWLWSQFSTLALYIYSLCLSVELVFFLFTRPALCHLSPAFSSFCFILFFPYASHKTGTTGHYVWLVFWDGVSLTFSRAGLELWPSWSLPLKWLGFTGMSHHDRHIYSLLFPIPQFLILSQFNSSTANHSKMSQCIFCCSIS
jgi:hypothetical protein